jgi:hypothetical protein
MPNLNDVIEGFVLGDALQVQRTITEIPAGETIDFAWFTVKLDLDDDPTDGAAKLQKEITSAPSTDGQITDPGSGDPRTATVLFNVLPDDTKAWAHLKPYQFDVQVKLSGGALSTPFRGRMAGHKGVTNKTAG